LCTNITMFWLIESADLSYNHNLNGFLCPVTAA